MTTRSQCDLNVALDVGVCHIYFYKLFMNTLISQNMIKPLEHYISYAIKMFDYYFVMIIIPP